MAFATDVDNATKGMTDAANERTDFRAAIKTCQTSIVAVLDAYQGGGLNDKDKQAFDDKMIDICRYYEAAMR